MQSALSKRWRRTQIALAIAGGAVMLVHPLAGMAADMAEPVCAEQDSIVAGDPDPAIFSAEASKGVRAYWCERYDANGVATRAGLYTDSYSNGALRVRATYVDSKIEGPVAIFNEDGSPFLQGFLRSGEWSGAFQIFHDNGAPWFDATFVTGRLEGVLQTRYRDGALESETYFQAGREDGLARSFYPTAVGGRLKSEAHVEADELVGRHRLLDSRGELTAAINWPVGPAARREPGVDSNLRD